LQGLERIGDRGFVCYNLGNFLMDPASGHVQIKTALEQRCSGGVFVFEVDASGVGQVSVLPIYVDNDFCARWAIGERGQAILRRLAEMSSFLEPGKSLADEFARQRAERNLGPVFHVLWHHFLRGHWRILLAILAGLRLRHVISLVGMLRVRLSGGSQGLRAS
jgi:hypothetical protein